MLESINHRHMKRILRKRQWCAPAPPERAAAETRGCGGAEHWTPAITNGPFALRVNDSGVLENIFVGKNIESKQKNGSPLADEGKRSLS